MKCLSDFLKLIWLNQSAKINDLTEKLNFFADELLTIYQLLQSWFCDRLISVRKYIYSEFLNRNKGLI